MSSINLFYKFSQMGLVLLLLVRPAWAVSEGELSIALIQELENCLTGMAGDDRILPPQPGRENVHINAVYNHHSAKPLWVDCGGPGPQAQVIRTFLENADTEGLDPTDYGVKEIELEWPNSDPGALARLDVLLTRGLLDYIYDIRYGRIRLSEIGSLHFAEARNEQFDSVDVINEVLALPDLAAFLASLPPVHRYYQGLKEMLVRYRQLEAEGGWGQIMDGPIIRPGDRDYRIPAVRARLLATGDVAPGALSGNMYESKLELAVRRFQKRHGLASDGAIGPQTRRAMNIPIREVVHRIALNMARWRWQEHDLGDRYVLVNIASYRLLAVDGGEVELDMAVIVGKEQHQTPVFSDMITYVEFNPYWNIPTSIARDEYLPKLQQDPWDLFQNNIRLFSHWGDEALELDSTEIDWQQITPKEMERFKLRQDPGAWNILGQVKFVFPNHYDVYLHDTVSHHLFGRVERDLSHGCVRVSYPLELADFVLDGMRTGWDQDWVDEQLEEGDNVIVVIQEPLPVHITYQTAWVDKDGTFHLNKDVYGRDQRLIEALFPVAAPAEAANESLSADEREGQYNEQQVSDRVL